MNQSQLAELFDTSKQNIGQHILSILKDNELNENSVGKNYFTIAADGKEYNVTFSDHIFYSPIKSLGDFRRAEHRIWFHLKVFY